MSTSSVTSARSRLNALRRYRPADDPAVLEARRALAAAGLERHIRRASESAPSLALADRVRLAALLLVAEDAQ